MNTAEIHEREADFHDKWARSTRVEEVRVRECFEAPTALENQFIMQKIGELRGTKLLDIGAGLGESAVYLALQGAEVTAVDISPAMIEKAIAVGRHHGVQLKGIASVGEDMRVPENTFDLIYTANTIHHVADRVKFFQQMHRTLKPGGYFFSIDPIAYNPVINEYRKMASRVRTSDESPLTVDSVALARQFFANVGHREFWILSLVLFLKYYLIDRVHPNQDRYWKRILDETEESLWWWKPLRQLDRLLTRVPGIRWWAWNMVMWGEKPKLSSAADRT